MFVHKQADVDLAAASVPGAQFIQNHRLPTELQCDWGALSLALAPCQVLSDVIGICSNVDHVVLCSGTCIPTCSIRQPTERNSSWIEGLKTGVSIIPVMHQKGSSAWHSIADQLLYHRFMSQSASSEQYLDAAVNLPADLTAAIANTAITEQALMHLVQQHAQLHALLQEHRQFGIGMKQLLLLWKLEQDVLQMSDAQLVDLVVPRLQITHQWWVLARSAVRIMATNSFQQIMWRVHKLIEAADAYFLLAPDELLVSQPACLIVSKTTMTCVSSVVSSWLARQIDL